MIHTITTDQLQSMLTTAAELGAQEIINRLGLDKKQVQQQEAYRLYGRARIDFWRKEGHIRPTKQGTRIYYDKEKLNKIASMNRLVDHL